MRALRAAATTAQILTGDARDTPEIGDGTVALTVTSPPFLDVVQYATDNWLRCWFAGVDIGIIGEQITVTPDLNEWTAVMGEVLRELCRVTRPGGWVAFEVGEVKKGRVCLDEFIAPAGAEAGLECRGILVNRQTFTKTANLWGVENNAAGTNTNRVVLFQKP